MDDRCTGRECRARGRATDPLAKLHVLPAGLEEILVECAEAEEEIDRYIAIPGQALAYKIGERNIIDLRERAKSALGEKFDLKRFHDAILRDGAMPLAILDAKVERWIADQKASIL